MKERPILFSAPMVKAILESRKTQTRRVVKNVKLLEYLNSNTIEGPIQLFSAEDCDHPISDLCPYGQPGDRLWVRETWAARPDMDGLPPSRCDDSGVWWKASLSSFPEGYAACHGKWRPSIFMPRKFSRILLKITSVRVERLQDISEDDAISEGLKPIVKDRITVKYGIPDMDGLPGNDDIGWPWGDWNVDPRKAYKTLWESINGSGSWEKNPWVWVVEFRRAN